MLEEIPPMNPEDLEMVLKHLPEPTSVEVYLSGNYDFSSVYSQMEEVQPGAKFKRGNFSNSYLENPSKEKILEIYKSSSLTLGSLDALAAAEWTAL